MFLFIHLWKLFLTKNSTPDATEHYKLFTPQQKNNNYNSNNNKNNYKITTTTTTTATSTKATTQQQKAQKQQHNSKKHKSNNTTATTQQQQPQQQQQQQEQAHQLQTDACVLAARKARLPGGVVERGTTNLTRPPTQVFWTLALQHLRIDLKSL